LSLILHSRRGSLAGRDDIFVGCIEWFTKEVECAEFPGRTLRVIVVGNDRPVEDLASTWLILAGDIYVLEELNSFRGRSAWNLE
jgi:hypothetical protein